MHKRPAQTALDEIMNIIFDPGVREVMFLCCYCHRLPLFRLLSQH